jgi:outer membrane receptor protein involved in Fe transport
MKRHIVVLAFQFLLLCSVCGKVGYPTDRISLHGIDTGSIERISVVNIDAALLRKVSWENQPYRTIVKTNSHSVGGNTRTVPEMLSYETGVMVQKTNHGGGSPSLRGLHGNQTLMMVDGVRLNNSIFRYGPNQYLNTVDAFAVDQLDVLFGSGSIQYGSDAMGGVIAAKFHEPEFVKCNQWVPKVFFRTTTGNQEYSMRSSVDRCFGQNAITAGITMRQFGDVLAGGDLKYQRPSGYKEFDVDVKFVRKDKLGKWVAAHQSNNQFDVPIFHRMALENYKFYNTTLQARTLTYLKRSLVFSGKLFDEIELMAGRQNQHEHREFQKNNSNLLRTERDSVNTYFFTTKFYGKLHNRWQWVLGTDFYFDKVNSARTDADVALGTLKQIRGLYPNGSTQMQNSAFGYITKTGDRGLVRLGGRYNYTQITLQTLETGNVQYQKGAFVADGAGSFKVTKKLHLYGNVGTGFRSPNIDDMGTLGIVDFRFETPQYGLLPEYSFNKELGLKYKSAKSQFNVCVFHNAMSGLISRIKAGSDSMQGYPVYQKQNVGSSLIYGAELDWKHEWGGHWVFGGGGSLIVGDNITGNEPMRRIPPAMCNAVLRYKLNGSVSFSMNIIGARAQLRLAKGDIQDNRIGPAGTPGYFTGDLRCEMNFKRATVDIAILNLRNQRYKTHGSGIYSMGRAVQLLIGIK